MYYATLIDCNGGRLAEDVELEESETLLEARKEAAELAESYSHQWALVGWVGVGDIVDEDGNVYEGAP